MAEGYIFEFERRGYLKSGSFVPEVVLDHPELVKSLHEEYVHSGSDVVLAFTVIFIFCKIVRKKLLSTVHEFELMKVILILFCL